MPTSKKRICIISFSRIAGDARVLRQIEYLSSSYDLTVIGYGEERTPWPESNNVQWRPVSAASTAAESPIKKLKKRALLLSGKLAAGNYENWYWHNALFRNALAQASASGAHAFHANDWNTLPVAIEAAKQLGARVVFDAHEYAPLEFENRRLWRLLYAPVIRHILSKYAHAMDASITVAPAIADRYRREFALDPVVILNAPAAHHEPSHRAMDFEKVRLVHHGASIPDRRLEVMIEALALSHRRFTLHFLLMNSESDYVNQLRRLAEKLTPGRVFFSDAVPPDQVVARVADFDMGLCYIAPTNYNYLVSLPNKFFDYIAAGLPVCIGPSPSMVEIVEHYGIGCTARSFEASDLAAALNGLTPERLAEMSGNARRAAGELNAEREMSKLLGIYERLWGEE